MAEEKAVEKIEPIRDDFKVEKIEKKLPSPDKVMDIKVDSEAGEKTITEIPALENDADNMVALSNAQQKQKEQEEEIEKVLEKDLAQVYMSLTPEKQKEFMLKGEETAKEISGLLQKAKLKVQKIIDLIIKWLSVIPGANRYFLEQEAKIKADEILKLRKL